MCESHEELALTRRMAILMGDKLATNRHKPHWLTSDLGYLIGRLYDEVTELRHAVENHEDNQSVWGEAADVANFAAMIADRQAALTPGDTEQ